MNTSLKSPLAACAAAALVFLACTGAYVVAVDQSRTTSSLPACATEDSDNCVWDATTRGDHTGRSFVTVHGVTHYLDGGK